MFDIITDDSTKGIFAEMNQNKLICTMVDTIH